MDDKNFYIPRILESFLRKASDQFPVLLLIGPRQVGKTTLLQHAEKEKRRYITFDDPAIAALAKEEPGLFLQRFSPPLLIDEIQYAPELLPHIKMYVDQHSTPGLFWLTGSQQFHLMKGVSESLAGRVGMMNLLGLSLEELHESRMHLPDTFLPIETQLQQRQKNFFALDLMELYRIIWKGSFPALWMSRKNNERLAIKANEMDRDLFYSSYVQSYLQRDIRDLAHVGDATVFLKFLRAAAARTGQLLNISDLARDVGMSPNTIKNWLSILEMSGIIYLLEPYHNNVTKRLIKTPKLYFLDTGLCAYLTEWTTPETLEAGAMSGAIFETFIFTEILKSYWYRGKRAPLYYYRDKDQKEIDLLIVQNDTLYPLEFKKTMNPQKEDIRHFKVLENLNKSVGEGGIICLASDWLPISKGVHGIPVGFL